MQFDKTEWQARWQALTPRERWLGVIGLSSVIGALFYVVLYAPLQDNNRHLQQRLQAQQALFRHLQTVADKAKVLQTKTAGDPADDPAALIDQTLATLSLQNAVTRQPATSDGQFDLAIDAVDFDIWLQWLAELHHRGLVVKSLKIQRSQADGTRIRGTLSLIQQGAAEN